MKNHTAFYTILLSLLPSVGPSRYWSLIEKYGSAEQALLAPPESLKQLSPEAKKILYAFQNHGDNSSLANKGLGVLEILDKCNAKAITHLDEAYPNLLKQINRPPPVIYTKGNTDLLSLPQIAIVGTRNPTTAGIENTRIFARYLARGGFTITSGLALGIDAAAHEATLTTKGKTIAVMATGIDTLYPQKHQPLANAILEQDGLLVTEFPPATQPRAVNFPRRNRIISGLSLGVLVIEAAVKSGSLITARYSLDQNREVFAIPGSIHSPQSKGCHALIKSGAQLVETGEDIVKQLTGIIHYFVDKQQANTEEATCNRDKNTGVSTPHVLNHKEKQVLDSIGYDTVIIEHIIERTMLSSADISVTLVNLEMKGLIKHSSWGYQVIHKEAW